jgi:geranylgeranyl diphosphate synthase, type II
VRVPWPFCNPPPLSQLTITLSSNKPVTLSTADKAPAVDFDRLRPRIDAALTHYTQFDGDCPAHLAEAIRDALLGPGKRLRPQLVLMATEACGGSTDAAMPAACAVEMVHAYSLVHDDLPAMDNDDLRRGRPTCHKRFGEDVAILVGDALLARAFDVLASELQPPAIAAQCCAVLGRAAGATALVGGQADDLQHAKDIFRASLETANDLDQLQAIHRRKTGALFVASLEIGGIVAGASTYQLAMLRGYGERVGLAFQITDDLLDVTGNVADVGKQVAKDSENGKLTFPALLGVEESRRRAAEIIDDACAIIEQLGPTADPLVALARFVVSREK